MSDEPDPSKDMAPEEETLYLRAKLQKADKFMAGLVKFIAGDFGSGLRELTVPLSDGKRAEIKVPWGISQEDIQLLIETLKQWERVLTQPDPTAELFGFAEMEFPDVLKTAKEAARKARLEGK